MPALARSSSGSIAARKSVPFSRNAPRSSNLSLNSCRACSLMDEFCPLHSSLESFCCGIIIGGKGAGVKDAEITSIFPNNPQ